jgi:hypothetical protein
MVSSVEHRDGKQKQGEVFVDIPQFFMRIIYRELVIVLRQISYHFSPPIILSAQNSVGRSVIPF